MKIISAAALINYIGGYREAFSLGFSRRVLRIQPEIILPAKYVIPITKQDLWLRNVSNPNVNMALYIVSKTHDFEYFSGNISLQKMDGSILGEICIPKLTGSTITLFGESFTYLLKGKFNKEEFIKLMRISVRECPDILNLVVDLDWNCRGWNSRLEREIPADAKAFVDINVFRSQAICSASTDREKPGSQIH